jgi:hypothetical protein
MIVADLMANLEMVAVNFRGRRIRPEATNPRDIRQRQIR